MLKIVVKAYPEGRLSESCPSVNAVHSSTCLEVRREPRKWHPHCRTMRQTGG